MGDGLPLKSPGTVTVGVTGHRYLRGVGELAARIDAVLDSIEVQWPGVPLTAISALAEGSDRLVAQRVLHRPGARLTAVLPMAEEEYIRDFTLTSSAQEFLDLIARADCIVRFPPAPTRPAAYATAGHYAIDHCDVLIALWNGEPPRGEGGTGAMVALARWRRCPLIWIHASNCNPDHTVLLPEDAQGTITFENF